MLVLCKRRLENRVLCEWTLRLKSTWNLLFTFWFHIPSLVHDSSILTTSVNTTLSWEGLGNKKKWGVTWFYPVEINWIFPLPKTSSTSLVTSSKIKCCFRVRGSYYTLLKDFYIEKNITFFYVIMSTDWIRY